MPTLPAPPAIEPFDQRDPAKAARQVEQTFRAVAAYLELLRQELERGKVSVVATAALAAAAADQDGKLVVEDAGVGDRNIVFYGGGQRFRVDGGVAV